MLQELHIRNFAIIEELDLSFSEGLNILSGETGAGKSIIIGALTLLLGGRVSAEMVRSSAEEAVVEALFKVGRDHEVQRHLESWGIPCEEQLLMRRVVSRAGKGRAFVNGCMATLQMLSQLGTKLISFTGQHEHQTLLHSDTHCDILDAFGGLGKVRSSVEHGYRRLLEVMKRQADLQARERDKEQRKELLRFQIEEIEAAKVVPGEEERLLQEERVLGNAQKLIELCHGVYENISQSPGAALQRLRESLGKLRAGLAIDSSLGEVYRAIETSLFHLEDVSQALRDYLERVAFDQRRLEEIGERLEELAKLRRKYGGSLADVLRFKEIAQQELALIELSEEEGSRLEREIQALRKEVIDQALVLSRAREEAAEALSREIEKECSSLGMGKMVFKVGIKKAREGERKDGFLRGVLVDGLWLTEKGIDVVEFLVTPNPGEELKPLAKIASGGELSRMVLALKRVVARERGASTLIFDEVDSGIGGAIAEVVGRKLKEIACQQQILCITHLPQIASYADVHQSVYKEVKRGRTRTLVRRLESPEEREEEIARMLGGVNVTSKTRAHAREMLMNALNREGEAGHD